MTFGYSFNIWVPLLLFPTAGPYGAPRWKKGWPVALVFFFLLWAGFMTAVVIHRREKRKEAAMAAQESTDEDVETIIVDRDAHAKAGSKD
ncbi:hypothetical protein PoHVEF18_004434 [Penicillium ochrochloron]